MARARNIKPGFYKNEELAECSVWARLLFPGLWMLADREGRLEDRPKRVKAELFPFDTVDVGKLLDELQARGFLVRYTNEDGNFIQINKFLDHQSPHYSEKPSAIKPCGFSENSRNSQATKKRDSQNPQAIKRGSQPPDSLNPDSLNPESLSETTPAVPIKTTAASEAPAGAVPADAGTQPPKPGNIAQGLSLDALRTAPAVGTPEETRSGELWAVLAANSCKGTAQHPAVVEMARAGVTVAELRAAIAEARKTQPGQINPAYLAAIVERMRSAPAKPDGGKAAAWARDDKALDAKARDLGINPRAGETYDDLRRRVRDRIAEQAREAVR